MHLDGVGDRFGLLLHKFRTRGILIRHFGALTVFTVTLRKSAGAIVVCVEGGTWGTAGIGRLSCRMACKDPSRLHPDPSRSSSLLSCQARICMLHGGYAGRPLARTMFTPADGSKIWQAPEAKRALKSCLLLVRVLQSGLVVRLVCRPVRARHTAVVPAVADSRPHTSRSKLIKAKLPFVTA